MISKSDSGIPALIPESIIERKYEKVLDGNGNEVKPKDINRSPNVTDRIENYIQEHNSSLPVDSAKRFLWFSDNLSNRQRQKRAKSIIKDNMKTHLQIEWVDGSITFNKCQIEHGNEVEGCIEKIAAIPLMSVYAQTERSWGIRKLMEEIVGNTRKSYLRQKKRIALAEPDQIRETQDIVPSLPETGSETAREVFRNNAEQHGSSCDGEETNGLSDEIAAAAAVAAFREAEREGSTAVVMQTSDDSDDSINEIEARINSLRAKKRKLQASRRENQYLCGRPLPSVAARSLGDSHGVVAERPRRGNKLVLGARRPRPSSVRPDREHSSK